MKIKSNPFSYFSEVLVIILAFMIFSVQMEANNKIPEKVKVGIYLVQIPAFDIVSCTYDMDFWIWFIWIRVYKPLQDF